MRPVERPRLFAFHFGVAEMAVLGAFLAQDLALFVLFFDLMLVPFYFLVGQWGGPNRAAAALKMVIYTLVGSLLMLAAAVATAALTASQTGNHITFVLSDLQRHALPEEHAEVALHRVRAGLPDQDAGVPFHGWMPDALPARCRCRRWRSSPAWCRRSRPTGSCGSCCPCSRRRPTTSR